MTALQAESTRAKRPHGFEIYECWGGFLDTDNRMALALFDDCFDGVRIMAKFDEYVHSPATFKKWVKRAEIATDMGKRLHLCIDWHNTATGPNDYHDHVYLPAQNKIAKMVGAIIKEFPKAAIVEVGNEPYYVQNSSQRLTINTYKPIVSAFIDGMAIGNSRGKLLASQSNKDFWKKAGDRIPDGWEWMDKRWGDGMLEGVHSAVLHKITDPNALVQFIVKDWYNGKAVGWQHPIYESEMSPVGKLTPTNSPRGARLYGAVMEMAKDKQLPVCFLSIDGKSADFGAGNNWAGAMHLVNAYEDISIAGREIYDFRGLHVPQFNVPDPPDVDPPDVDPDTSTGDTANRSKETLIRQITGDLDFLGRRSLKVVKQVTSEMKRLRQRD